MKTLSDSLSVRIEADAATVWKVLTESEFTKQYMFNCSVETDWKPGSSIVWQGHFQGYDAYQKGEILAAEPGKSVKYSTFDPNFGLEDRPENYVHVTYETRPAGEATELIILNETFDGNAERMAHVRQGWEMVIGSIKEVAEKV